MEIPEPTSVSILEIKTLVSWLVWFVSFSPEPHQYNMKRRTMWAIYLSIFSISHKDKGCTVKFNYCFLHFPIPFPSCKMRKISSSLDTAPVKWKCQGGQNWKRNKSLVKTDRPDHFSSRINWQLSNFICNMHYWILRNTFFYKSVPLNKYQIIIASCMSHQI